MTKEEAIAKLGERMTANAELIITLSDAAEAIKASPLARQVVVNAMYEAAGIRESEAFEALDAIAGMKAKLFGDT